MIDQTGQLLRKLKRLQNLVAVKVDAPEETYAEYRDDPVGFMRDILHVTPSPDQSEIAQLLLKPPYRVLVKAGHSTGKSWISSCVALWWWMTRRPATVITTAPRMESVERIIWKTMRAVARKANLPVPFQPVKPLARRDHNDYMIGTTSRDGTAFQGHHDASMLFLFDEATAVPPEIWEVTTSMFQGEGHGWIAIFNPTDTATEAYRRTREAISSDGKALWHVHTMSCLNHPNIALDFKQEPPLAPDAIRVEQLDTMLREWCETVQTPRPGDIAWPPEWVPCPGNVLGYEKRVWLRPGPIAESRVLGIYPSRADYAVWGEGDWRQAEAVDRTPLPLPKDTLPEVGIDLATFGADYSTVHVRCGPCSLFHFRVNGWLPRQMWEWVKRHICQHYAEQYNQKMRSSVTVPLAKPQDILVKVDRDGAGTGFLSDGLADGYKVVGIPASSRAWRPQDYPNKRSELWFFTVNLCRDGRVDISRLDKPSRRILEEQALGLSWKLNNKGQQEVEKKDDYRKRRGYSPDDMDAMNLAYMRVGSGEMPSAGAPRRGAGHSEVLGTPNVDLPPMRGGRPVDWSQKSGRGR